MVFGSADGSKVWRHNYKINICCYNFNLEMKVASLLWYDHATCSPGDQIAAAHLCVAAKTVHYYATKVVMILHESLIRVDCECRNTFRVGLFLILSLTQSSRRVLREREHVQRAAAAVLHQEPAIE